MTIILFGIKACDTMKRARAWLDEHEIMYDFHDYKTAGIDPMTVSRWVEAHGWENVLNRSGTTFRKLSDADRTDLDAEKAIGLMVAQPSMIKRPVLDLGSHTLIGFKPERYAAAFA